MLKHLTITPMQFLSEVSHLVIQYDDQFSNDNAEQVHHEDYHSELSKEDEQDVSEIDRRWCVCLTNEHKCTLISCGHQTYLHAKAYFIKMEAFALSVGVKSKIYYIILIYYIYCIWKSKQRQANLSKLSNKNKWINTLQMAKLFLFFFLWRNSSAQLFLIFSYGEIVPHNYSVQKKIMAKLFREIAPRNYSAPPKSWFVLLSLIMFLSLWWWPKRLRCAVKKNFMLLLLSQLVNIMKLRCGQLH